MGQTYLEKGERKNTWKRDPWGTSLWHDASTLSCKFRASFPSLGSTACIHVNPIDGYQCSDEFRAQLNLTEKPKRSDHTCKACPVTCSCQNGCGNALELHWKRRLLSWLPAMHNGRKERWCQAQQPAVSTITRPTCETMKKWPAVHST